jgi:CRISPR/Cas system-associated exonuclease Cas4 (RecB family)
MGIVVSSEINIPAQEIISGRADAIISLNNQLYVLDIKSINSMVFKNLTTPREENIYQLQLYLHYFNIKKGILFYIDKDQQDIKEFLIEYNPRLVQSLLNNFKNIKEKIDSNIVPCRIPGWPDDWQCQYCQFKEVCGMGEGGEMKWEDFKKKIESQNTKEA